MGPARKSCRSASARWSIEAIEPVGSYAVKLVFSDGHDTGLYSWDYLHELGSEPATASGRRTWTVSGRPVQAGTPRLQPRASGAGRRPGRSCESALHESRSMT